MENQTDQALVIINPKAGNGNLVNSLKDILPELSMKYNDLKILHTKKEGDAKELCRQYGEFVSTVIVFGGDGTVFECTNGLAPLHKRPTLAIIPGGTCNDFSRTLGIPQNIKQAVQTIVQGYTTHVDVAQANEHYFLNFLGMGLVEEVSNNIDPNEKSLFGKLGYYLSTIRTLKEADTFNVSVTIDGQQYNEELVVLLIGNGEYIGGMSSFIPNVSYNDGILDILMVKNTDLQTLKEFFSSRIFNQEFSENIIHVQGTSIDIQTPQPHSIDTDGEHVLKTPCKIQLLPGHFQMIANPIA